MCPRRCALQGLQVLAGALQIFFRGRPRQRWADAPTVDAQIELEAAGPSGHRATGARSVRHAWFPVLLDIPILPESTARSGAHTFAEHRHRESEHGCAKLVPWSLQ
jgi:hypothetical protein